MVTATLTPSALADGESLIVEIAGLEHFVGCSLSINLRGIDDFTTQWVASGGAVIDEAGHATQTWQINLGRETLLEVASLRLETDTGERSWENPGALAPSRAQLNGSLSNPSDDDLLRCKTEFEERQRLRYELPIGPVTASGTYRVLCVVERLLLTQPLRLAGVHLIPANRGSSGAGEAEILNTLLSEIGWRARIPQEWWADRSRTNRPWTLIVLPEVRADDEVGAATIASEERDHILNLLALNRIASGRPVATVVEALGSGASWVFHEDEQYRGNLIGGITAGEDQADVLIQNAALRADPLLALLIDFLRQAIGEVDVDAAYFRYWSILEVLAGARLPAAQVVTLIDGAPWPTTANTTTSAAPRVYELLKRSMAARQIGESSGMFSPAADLLEAVRCWYGRRNATAHYGAFRPNDPVQQAQTSWYPYALRTTTQGDETDWLRALRDVVRFVAGWELRDVGGPLV